MGRLIFVRHGESVANAEGRFTRGPHEGLTARGRREAEERAAELAARARPVALYTSPFTRARETAALLGGVLELEARVVEALREQFFGALHGRPHSALAETVEPHGLARWDYRPPEGETLREVADRVGPAVAEIAARHPGEEVVVVSHGGVMAALRGWLEQRYDRAPALSANASGYWLAHGLADAGPAPARFGAPQPLESLVPD